MPVRPRIAEAWIVSSTILLVVQTPKKGPKDSALIGSVSRQQFYR